MTLMGLFLQHPDQTLERKHIMQQVWETDYLEDTRTLDVHIRWLRKVVEPNPRKPKYLVTVRGIGYRFEIPDEDEPPVEENTPAPEVNHPPLKPAKSVQSANTEK
jgi:DNA-binding winged helix-turn-helix (wHTH) protein